MSPVGLALSVVLLLGVIAMTSAFPSRNYYRYGTELAERERDFPSRNEAYVQELAGKKMSQIVEAASAIFYCCMESGIGPDICTYIWDPKGQYPWDSKVARTEEEGRLIAYCCMESDAGPDICTYPWDSKGH